MAGLVDRLGKADAEGGVESINAHALLAVQLLQARGHLTKARSRAALKLGPDDVAQWDALQAWTRAASDDAELLLRLAILDAITTALELDFIDTAQANAILRAEGAV